MENEFITIDTNNCLRLTHRKHIPTNKIIYMESEINYTNVCTTDNRKHISSFTLKILEARIVKKDFLRINRGCLVNLNHVTHIIGIKGNSQARLSDGSVLVIARRKYEIIKNRLDSTMMIV